MATALRYTSRQGVNSVYSARCAGAGGGPDIDLVGKVIEELCRAHAGRICWQCEFALSL